MIENGVQINNNIQIQDENSINGNEELIGDMNREELGLFYLFQASSDNSSKKKLSSLSRPDAWNK